MALWNKTPFSLKKKKLKNMKDYLKMFLTSEPSSFMIFDFVSCVPSAFLQTTGRL